MIETTKEHPIDTMRGLELAGFSFQVLGQHAERLLRHGVAAGESQHHESYDEERARHLGRVSAHTGSGVTLRLNSVMFRCSTTCGLFTGEFPRSLNLPSTLWFGTMKAIKPAKLRGSGALGRMNPGLGSMYTP